MPGGNGIPRRSSGQAGPSGQGPGSGRGMRGGGQRPAQNAVGQRPAQGADSPDWLVNTVGTLVLALGSIVFRALTKKSKASPEKDAKTGNKEKSKY